MYLNTQEENWMTKVKSASFTKYSEESKAYRLYDHITKKFIISIYIEFKEEYAWDGSIDESIVGGVALPQSQGDGEAQIVQSGHQICNTSKSH